MITRYSLTASAEMLGKHFGAEVPESYRILYSAAPAHLLPVITHDSQKGFSLFYWGAPPEWARNKALGEKVINIRTETVSEKTALRKKMCQHRCIIPADGFYEWKRIGKKATVPYRFVLKDKSIFAMAGMWEEYEDESGDTNHTFSILTIPNPHSVHNFAPRLPLVLPETSVKSWLNESSEDLLMKLLSEPIHDFEHYSVSTLINSPERNERIVTLPAPAADQFGNLTLFD